MTEDYLEGYGIAPPDGSAYSSNEEYQAAFDAWFAGFEAYIFQLGAEKESARLAAEEEARQAEEARLKAEAEEEAARQAEEARLKAEAEEEAARQAEETRLKAEAEEEAARQAEEARLKAEAEEEAARQAEEARAEREQIPDPSDRYSVGAYVGEFPQEGVVYDPRSVGSYVDEDGNLRTADGELFSPGTTPAMEPVAAAEPVTGEPVIDTALLLVDLLDALTGEEGMTDDVDGIQQTVDEIRQALDRPLMTTSFQDYTVTEGLLLLLLLSAFVAACARMLKEGFSWLK